MFIIVVEEKVYFKNVFFIIIIRRRKGNVHCGQNLKKTSSEKASFHYTEAIVRRVNI